MKDLFSIEGKVALVTGGSRGIGSMIAAGFLAFLGVDFLAAGFFAFSTDHSDRFSRLSVAYDVTEVANMSSFGEYVGAAMRRNAAGSTSL